MIILLLSWQTLAAQQFLPVFPEGDKPEALLYFFLVIFAIFLVLTIHESGHLVAGLLQGFRFEFWVVGLLGIKRTPKGIRPFLNTNIGYMGGICCTVPERQSNRNKQKFANMILAGPLTSLLFALLALLLYYYSSSGAGRALFLISGIGSACIFLATTLPKKTGVFFTDRARFQRLISGGKESVAEEALLNIITQYTVDNSCLNILPEHAWALQNDDDKVMQFWGFYYEYQHLTDRQLTEEAAAAKLKLLAVKDSIPAALWNSLKIEEKGVAAT